jgi:predicted nucleotidyltransferase
MRLDSTQKSALDKALKDVSGEAYLFGSRVNDQARVGDVDVLIFSDQDPFKLSQEVSVNYFMECEEKIDVIVMDPNNLTPEQVDFL